MNDRELGFGLVWKGSARREFFGSLLRIVCNGSRSRIWHYSLRSKDAGEFGQFWHVCGGSQKDVEVDFSGVDVSSDFVGENGNLNFLACGVRELELAFDSRVSHVEVKFDCFELGSLAEFGQELNSVFNTVKLILFDLFGHSFVFFGTRFGLDDFFNFFFDFFNSFLFGDFGGYWSRFGGVDGADGVDIFFFDAFDSHEFTIFFGDELLRLDTSGSESFSYMSRKVVVEVFPDDSYCLWFGFFGCHIIYSTMLIPIDLAVPSTILTAESTLLVFMSASFFSAIALIWALVIDPTFFLFGSPEPSFRFRTCLMRAETGGVLSSNLKDLSS